MTKPHDHDDPRYAVKKSDAEWRAQLDPMQYQVARHAATDPSAETNANTPKSSGALTERLTTLRTGDRGLAWATSSIAAADLGCAEKHRPLGGGP